jgi:hypothetical protein
MSNITSVANIHMPPEYGNDNDWEREIIIRHCNAIQTIGNMEVYLNGIDSRSYVDIAFNPVLQSVGNVRANFMSALFIYECNALTSIGNITFSNIPGTSLYIHNNPALTSLGTITFDQGVGGGIQFWFYNNNFSSAVISQLLVDLDATGSIGNVLDYTGNPGYPFGSLTPAGQTAYNNLMGKSWTIY